jgi:uncharacterized protein with HEPN domain
MRSETLKIREALQDIIDNIRLAQDFTRKVSFESFAKDRQKIYAVVRCLEIISEASRRLTDKIKDRHTQIQWKAMAAAGNVYRHEYGGVEESEIWNTVENHLPPLLIVAESELVWLADD